MSVLHLLSRIVEVEERTHSRRPLARKRCKEASEIHDPFHPATEARVPLESSVGVGQLDRLDVDANHLVLGRDLQRRATCRGGANDAASRPRGL
jgi:hypothetical protein